MPSCDFPVRVSSSSASEPSPSGQQSHHISALVYRPFFISPFFLHARERPPSLLFSFSLTQWDNPQPHNLAPPLLLYTHTRIVHTHRHILCQILMDMQECSTDTHIQHLHSHLMCEYHCNSTVIFL